MSDNERIAQILDPQNEQGWFTRWGDGSYEGPDFSDRAEAWRMEVWLEERRVQFARESGRAFHNRDFVTTTFKHRVSPDMREGMRKILGQSADHNAALIAAVLAVSEGRK